MRETAGKNLNVDCDCPFFATGPLALSCWNDGEGSDSQSMHNSNIRLIVFMRVTIDSSLLEAIEINFSLIQNNAE